MGRIGDLGWWLRDNAGVIALALAIAALAAGVGAIVIALDAKDEAEDSGPAAGALSAPVAPDASIRAAVDELNERVAAIEESVSSLREDLAGGGRGAGGGGATPDETTELPEGLPEIPGVGKPEAEEPQG